MITTRGRPAPPTTARDCKARGGAARFALRLLAILALLRLAPAARAQTCEAIVDDAVHYTICVVDVRRDRLALFTRDGDGQPLATFDKLAAGLTGAHRALVFAMNAGMFEADLTPVGLLTAHGETVHPAATRDGDGNFFLKPNGVFFFGKNEVGLRETQAFLAAGLHPEFATQSGPMLVIDGRIHPRLRADGTSLKVRNGVGVRDAHTAVFAISDEPVSLHRFASLFRDRLRCPDALFLDGTVSALYDPALGRTRQTVPLGPMIGITVAVP